MMKSETPELRHSWPLFESGQHFDLGLLHGARDPAMIGDVPGGIGRWSCDLADDTLAWSPGTYDLFGFPRDATPTRSATVALYREDSRAVMERLRRHAIAHRRGFTLDVAIRPAAGDRWIRLTALPVCEGNCVVRLVGTKQDVTADYR